MESLIGCEKSSFEAIILRDLPKWFEETETYNCYLLNAVKQQTRLKVLDIADNKISGNDLAWVLLAVQHCPSIKTIEEVFLGGNYFNSRKFY